MYVFFFNDTATTEIYTLSLHDALPILEVLTRCGLALDRLLEAAAAATAAEACAGESGLSTARAMADRADRKSTRLNSSHANISYAVFCLKKKKQTQYHPSVLQSLSYRS